MLSFLDNIFCYIEGKVPEKNKDDLNFNEKRKTGIGTLFVNSLNHGFDEGLNGEWQKDKEKFKNSLLNDIKTFLFGDWEKPWKEAILTDKNGKILSYCNIKKRPYRGMLTLLNLYGHTKQSPFFVTPQYVSRNGGKIIDRSEITFAVGWIPFQKDAMGHLTPSDFENADVFLPKFNPVISTDFVEGIKVPEYKITEFEKKELIEYVENFIDAIKKRLPRIYYDKTDACYYNPLKDEIHLVKIDAFTNIVDYYKVLFHEVIHSTKHPSRLGRGKPLKNSKDKKAEYAAEELVAEMGAAILATELGLKYNRQNTIVYLKGWLNDAVRRSGKTQDEILLEAYGYAVDAAEYLMKDIDVDSILPKSIIDRASENNAPSKNKSDNNTPQIKETDKRVKTDKEGSDTKVVKPKKSEKVEVVEMPVAKIFTDEKRFQNRINAFSDESKNRIVHAVENGTFDWAKFDPITVWLDPKDKKYYVLSGHSRLAAFRELSAGNSDFKNIPAKVFKGSEKNAIDFALNSNTLATRETEVERAIYYNKQRMLCEVKKGLNGKTECEKLVEQQCRENEGKNANYILNLSYLNPKGFLMDNLIRLGIEKDNDSTNVLRTIANWVGEARRSNPEISDAQETEIAQFLLNGGYGNKAGQFRNKQQFMERLEYSFAKWKTGGADPSKSLNLANTLSKSSFEKEWDERLAKAKEELDNAIAEHEEKYKKYLFAVMEGKLTQERMDELMKPVVAFVERAKKEYDRVKGQKDEVRKAASAQTSLWGIDDDLNEQFNRELALLKQGKLSQNHIFQLGMPSECLIQSGIDRLPIELRAKTLKEKSKADYKASHPFDYDDIRNLPNALKHPIAVFQSLRHTNSKVVLTSLYSRSRNFVVAIEVARPIEREGSTILINDIRSLYPKDYVKDILNWICTYNLMLWVDKEKALNWISKLRRSAEVAKLIKGSTNIIQNFQNSTPNQLKTNNLLGLTSFSSTQRVMTYKLSGELGKFLGEYDRNRYSIVIRGDKGAGKSRLLYQLINAFASKGLRVAFLSLEMGINSSVTQKYKAEYINRKNLNRIHVTDNAPTLEQLQSLCNDYDVLAIDSWTKLLGVSQTDFDALLRKNPQTIVLSIFQSTTDKVTRGGNMPEYDSAVVIHVHRGGVAECEKNRFAPTTIRYNVFTKQIIDEPMEVGHE